MNAGIISTKVLLILLNPIYWKFPLTRLMWRQAKLPMLRDGQGRRDIWAWEFTWLWYQRLWIQKEGTSCTFYLFRDWRVLEGNYSICSWQLMWPFVFGNLFLLPIRHSLSTSSSFISSYSIFLPPDLLLNNGHWEIISIDSLSCNNALQGSSVDILFFLLYSIGLLAFKYFLTVAMPITISLAISIIDIPLSRFTLIVYHTSESNI